MGNDEILLAHFSTPLNRYDEEFFFLIQKATEYLKKYSSSFLSGIVIMNIIKFSEIIVEEICEYLIIKFKHEFCDFYIYHAV